MWDELAQMSIIHLKPGDVIYVWGDLCFYEKTGEDGKRKIFHGVSSFQIILLYIKSYIFVENLSLQ